MTSLSDNQVFNWYSWGANKKQIPVNEISIYKHDYTNPRCRTYQTVMCVQAAITAGLGHVGRGASQHSTVARLAHAIGWTPEVRRVVGPIFFFFFFKIHTHIFNNKEKKEYISWRVVLNSFFYKIILKEYMVQLLRWTSAGKWWLVYTMSPIFLSPHCCYIYKKQNKKKQQRLYSWNAIQPQLRKYQVLLLITQTFSRARFISRVLIKIPD